MNGNTKYIAKVANVSIEEALVIHQTIDNEYLVNWSEDSNAKINRKIQLAQALIANGNNWETLVVPIAWVK